jgi:hypothetical protein
MAWRPAPSVRRGLEEANERWPRRSRASDGILGDASHATMTSDHNPDARGIVHAFDLTHDPDGGPDCGHLSEHLRTVRDRRVRYVIWNGRLFRGPWSDAVLAGRAKPWIWERYTGDNPHRSHMHVSVGYSASAENDTSPWWEEQMTEDDRRWVQSRLNALYRLLARAEIDGEVSLAHRPNSLAGLREQMTSLHPGPVQPAGGGAAELELSEAQLDAIAAKVADKIAARLT